MLTEQAKGGGQERYFKEWQANPRSQASFQVVLCVRLVCVFSLCYIASSLLRCVVRFIHTQSEHTRVHTARVRGDVGWGLRAPIWNSWLPICFYYCCCSSCCICCAVPPWAQIHPIGALLKIDIQTDGPRQTDRARRWNGCTASTVNWWVN